MQRKEYTKHEIDELYNQTSNRESGRIIVELEKRKSRTDTDVIERSKQMMRVVIEVLSQSYQSDPVYQMCSQFQAKLSAPKTKLDELENLCDQALKAAGFIKGLRDFPGRLKTAHTHGLSDKEFRKALAEVRFALSEEVVVKPTAQPPKHFSGIDEFKKDTGNNFNRFDLSLIGDFGCGRRSLMYAYLAKRAPAVIHSAKITFPEGEQSDARFTVGEQILAGDQPFQLNFNVIEQAEKFSTFTSSTFAKAKAVVFLCDLSQADSVKNIPLWYKEGSRHGVGDKEIFSGD